MRRKAWWRRWTASIALGIIIIIIIIIVIIILIGILIIVAVALGIGGGRRVRFVVEATDRRRVGIFTMKRQVL
jgi:hypothetical protein